jgi:hypothetical protein
MANVRAEQIGTALRGLAEDLVRERQLVAQLRRENRELRSQLEQLRRERGGGGYDQNRASSTCASLALGTKARAPH